MAGNWQDADPARTIDGAPQFSPTTVSWTVNTALQLVRINEVVAASGAGPDTIELWNGGATQIDLGGWSITDDPALPLEYIFPGGTVIPAGQYLVLSSATTGVNFDNDGDEVFLFNAAAQLVDSVEFGFQVPDRSIGRIPEAGGFPWRLCMITPNSANTRAPTGDPRALRINEWLAAGQVLYKEDWIELTNTSPFPVALDGLRLTDNLPGNSSAHVIAPLSFIAAGGYVKFIADGQVADGPNHLDFALDVQQEEISLLDGNGNLIDRVIFYPQIEDVSQSESAAGQPVYHELPTAGFANGTGAPGYANALAILRSLRITEIMFNAAGGNDFDWLELRNVGASPINLQGARFVEGIDFTFGSLVLAPDDTVVIVANQSNFISRYGAGANIAGQYSGRLDNGGETLILQLPPPFDANVMCFRYEDDWFPATDGQGRSLDLVSANTAPKDFGDRDSWRASAVDGGTPDGLTTSQPSTYSEWLTFYGTVDGADADGDGLPSVIEFSLGTGPQQAGTPNGADRLPVATLNGSGRLELRFAVPQNAGLAQGHGRPEITYAVQVADALNGWTTISTKSPTTNWTGTAGVVVGAASGGLVPITVTDLAGAQGNLRRFIRLRVTWAP